MDNVDYKALKFSLTVLTILSLFFLLKKKKKRRDNITYITKNRKSSVSSVRNWLLERHNLLSAKYLRIASCFSSSVRSSVRKRQSSVRLTVLTILTVLSHMETVYDFA